MSVCQFLSLWLSSSHVVVMQWNRIGRHSNNNSGLGSPYRGGSPGSGGSPRNARSAMPAGQRSTWL